MKFRLLVGSLMWGPARLLRSAYNNNDKAMRSVLLVIFEPCKISSGKRHSNITIFLYYALFARGGPERSLAA